ncbi:MAG: dihydropteroate synthase [Pseudomonadales bacterium]|nr:dihydropteroate synthase [Pseudomonadales bacterium]
MGVLNITPDSFSDGGQFFKASRLDTSKVLQQAEQMLQAGASILDIGGESTRPGAELVSSQQELDRVMPVLEQLQGIEAVISIDTSNPELMQAAKSYGVGLINDVRALQQPGALQAAADSGLPICLMHMQGTPQTMQQQPHYADLIAQVSDFFDARINACQQAGIARDRLLLDPGFGFGKTLAHNLALLKHLGDFKRYRLPLLVGLSRKSMIDAIHQQHGQRRAVDQRLPGSLALALLSYQAGADIIRVHDVQETADALLVAQALDQSL